MELKNEVIDILNQIRLKREEAQAAFDKQGKNCSTCASKGGHSCSDLFCPTGAQSCIKNGHNRWEAKKIKPPSWEIKEKFLEDLGTEFLALQSKVEDLENKLHCLTTSENCEGYNCYFATKVKELEKEKNHYKKALEENNCCENCAAVSSRNFCHTPKEKFIDKAFCKANNFKSWHEKPIGA
jgi:hypothetical protein